MAAGLSLSGMARRTGYSRSYLGNVETGTRDVTPAIIRAYEKVLGDDVNRRSLLLGMASAVAATAVPDVAVDVVRDIAAERSKLLSTVQTSHETDRAIGALIARDTPSVASLYRWMAKGSAILRVNSAGILSKIGSPSIDDDVVRALAADYESRNLYLTAVVSRVLTMPWEDAALFARSDQPLQDTVHIQRVASEARNRADSGARWCSTILLARTRSADPSTIDDALRTALREEQSRENLRAIAAALAGINPATVWE
jgi:transcriptional regulator with XRE-family HTH domain